jgi:protein-L-isoaspartate(D-aspartate) O-methyltransferase
MENERLIRLKIQLLFSLHFNGYLRDIRLFRAFLDVPLQDFIPKEILGEVRLYDDAPVLFYLDKENPASLRTISAPHMISIMLQELILNEDDDLLILGAKSGYIAVLAHKLAPKGKIVILEANSKIAKITKENLRNQNLNGEIEVIVKNPLEGFPELSPWQKILVTGAIKQERIHPLLKQLDSTEGVLFAPIGENYLQTYTQIIRFGNEFFGKKYLQVRFTPLITQIELDELKLITDFDELEAFTATHKKNNIDNTDFKGNIIVNYTSDVLDEVRLEPYSKEKSHEINDESIYDAIKQHMEKTIGIENKKENRKYLENINLSLEQIKKLIARIKKDIKEKGIVDPKHIGRKIDIINKYQLEVNNVQKKLKRDMS